MWKDSRPVSHSRFSPMPADLVPSRRQPLTLVKPPKNFPGHRQPKNSSASGIPVNFELNKAISCGKIG